MVTKESRPPKKWAHCKKQILLGDEADFNLTDVKQKSLKRCLDQRHKKTAHAEAYIMYIARLYADTCPTDGAIMCLPYESVGQFYNEYVMFCKSIVINFDCVAKAECFRLALLSLKGSIRLMTCKGAFQTCDICNNANDMLRGGKCRYSRQQREIILKFKRLHLAQQAQERRHQEKNRLEAAEMTPEGKTVKAYLLSDGMTAMRGDTPKVGGGDFRRGKQDSNCIGNRIIGNYSIYSYLFVSLIIIVAYVHI